MTEFVETHNMGTTNLTYSDAWLKVIPEKLGERVSVYISQPVPCKYFCILSLTNTTWVLYLQVIILPCCHVRAGDEGAHSKEVCHHGAESGSKTGLCDEAKLELCQADHVVPLLPVPAGDVEQVGLVVVLHQLDDHSDIIAVVLDGDDSHDVGGVLGVRIRAVFVGENQTGVSLVNLNSSESRFDRKFKFIHQYTI